MDLKKIEKEDEIKVLFLKIFKSSQYFIWKYMFFILLTIKCVFTVGLTEQLQSTMSVIQCVRIYPILLIFLEHASATDPNPVYL